MSKRINVNPDHYKVAGRERPGKDILPNRERQALRRSQEDTEGRAPRIPNQERAAAPRRKTLPRRQPETS